MYRTLDMQVLSKHMSVLELNANVTLCYCSDTTEHVDRKQLIQYQ